ncbi:PilZ domain-containing protein [Sphingomonas xanthus]|uniref:PilZ domain-containing protein n=1 Tax=Sphingomonas xanthus TaxID=2594473 RepID=A0A516INN6_9SPHN|nr:PilZ domain-containing protein [Sphingomonas xanthus]QDP18489.1 PilZ domain-containing protein [Sphingomonas xanthus]
MSTEFPERRMPRVELHKAAKIIDQHGVEWDAEILDLSNGGFRISCREPLLPGDRVTIVGDHGEPHVGQIKWALGQEAGGIFTEPVDTSLA